MQTQRRGNIVMVVPGAGRVSAARTRRDASGSAERRAAMAPPGGESRGLGSTLLLREPRAESREPRVYQPPGHAMPRLSRCRSPRPPEFPPPLAGDPSCADESRAAHLPAASGKPFAGRTSGAPVPLVRARGPKRALPKRATRGRGTSTGLRTFLTRLGVLLAFSTAVARRHSGLAMRFPGRSQHTGGRWLTALAARWLVDGPNSARCRRARAWPPQRAVEAKPPGSPERRGRRELSSSPPGRGGACLR